MPQHPHINAGIATIKYRLDQLATAQDLHINWGPTPWSPPEQLAQQYDIYQPRLVGGDCLLFVSCWTLCILAGDTPTSTSIQQKHMRNVRDQLLLIAVQADRAYTRRRTSELALAMDLCSDTALDTPTTSSEHPAVGLTPDNTTGNPLGHSGQPDPAHAATPPTTATLTLQAQHAPTPPTPAHPPTLLPPLVKRF